jgi:alpha-methylacyl-CoA racemase
MRPLEGMLVLDFSTLLPGPMATLLLAEAGAEVVKVEKPGRGDEMRSYEPKWGESSVNFAMLNRGKKSISVDLKDKAQLAKLKPMVERADVIVEQFRPGTMARLGLDYESVASVNPRVVYCSITGYGQEGPKRDIAAHDLNYIADSGLLALSMGEPDYLVVPPALIADIAGGAYPAFMNILLALMDRDHSGVGRHLDIAMADNLFPFMYWAIGNAMAAGKWPGNGSDLVTGGSPRYRLYATKDGKIIAAAPLEQKFWETFCEILSLESNFRDDTRDPSGTTRRVAEIIASDTAENWRRRFYGRDCCCTIVARLSEAVADTHFAARNLFSWALANETGHEISALPVPILPAFRSAPSTAAVPRLGEHNEKYLR